MAPRRFLIGFAGTGLPIGLLDWLASSVGLLSVLLPSGPSRRS